jgi:Restriction endonuclease
MIEPRPQQFGITQEQVDGLDVQVKVLEARKIKRPEFDEDRAAIVGFFFAAACWLIYVLASKAPTTSNKVYAGILSYFGAVIWLMIWSAVARTIFFKNRVRRATTALAALELSPLYEKRRRYRESQIAYEKRLQQIEEEHHREQEEWNRWQREWSKGQAQFWRSLDGIAFEKELANLYRALGYEASLTTWSGDDGVDIQLRKDGKSIVVQCKAHNKPVGSPTVRELFGSLHHFKADEAILACTGGFTSSAINFAKGKPIKLIKLEDILVMQAALLKNMPAPTEPRQYQQRNYNPSSRQPLNIVPPDEKAPRYQNVLSYVIPMVAGIAVMFAFVLLIPARSSTTVVAAAKPTPSPANATSLPSTAPTPSPSPSPSPSPTEEEEPSEELAENDYPELEAYPQPLLSPSITTNSNQSNSSQTANLNTDAVGMSLNSNSQPDSPPPFVEPLSREEERRLNKANDLRRLGIEVDWRAYSWMELSDIERRVRKVADLQRLGYNADWRKSTWIEMSDWERRIRKAEDLERVGLNVDWRKYEWLEMSDWERRIRKANDLRLYGINVNWQDYTWMQMYEMEQQARKKRR